MMILALIARPWILYMQQMGATPRTLADDLMLTMTSPEPTQGDDDGMMDTLCVAVEASLEFIHDMGGKPSPHKSAVMASSKEHRKCLRAQKVGRQRQHYPGEAQLTRPGVAPHHQWRPNRHHPQQASGHRGGHRGPHQDAACSG